MGIIRADFISGTLSAGLSNSGTSLSAAILASFPVVAAPDIAYLVIDPDGSAEIVKVTAHTAAATSATIVRGQLGTSAVVHSSGAAVIQAPLASDFDTVEVDDIPAGTTPDPANDDLLVIQGGAAVALTINDVVDAGVAGGVTAQSATATDGKAALGTSSLLKGALTLFANSGDTQPAALLRGGAVLSFGPGGSTAVDTSLWRVAANSLYADAALQLQNGASTTYYGMTAASFTSVDGTATNGKVSIGVNSLTKGIMAIYANSSDTQPTTNIFGTSISWGPGGSTATDVSLYRSASNTITVNATTLQLTDASTIGSATGTGVKIAASGTQKLGFWGTTPVVRATGWGAPTGTATRSTFATTTVTTEELAQRVKALIDDLTSYGIVAS